METKKENPRGCIVSRELSMMKSQGGVALGALSEAGGEMPTIQVHFFRF